METYWGINCLGHDASLCVIINNTVVFHKRASEYSNISRDNYLNQNLIDSALKFGNPDKICFYEKTWLKKSRQLYSGEYKKAFSLLTPKIHMMEFGIHTPMVSISHHHSHAAAAYYTTDIEDCIIIVADAIGEWDTVSVWEGKNNKLLKLETKTYPYSLGLFYSAFTKLANLTPMQDEGIFMKLSEKGDSSIYLNDVKKYILCNNHKGIKNWDKEIDNNVAAAVQKVFEDELIKITDKYNTKTLLMTGGCAYNSLAVKKLSALVTIDPGDNSSAIGAVAGYLNKRINLERTR